MGLFVFPSPLSKQRQGYIPGAQTSLQRKQHVTTSWRKAVEDSRVRRFWPTRGDYSPDIGQRNGIFGLRGKPCLTSPVTFINDPIWFECRISKTVTLLFYALSPPSGYMHGLWARNKRLPDCRGKPVTRYCRSLLKPFHYL